MTAQVTADAAPRSSYAPGVAALYFSSGAIGLAYQVLWARMLSLQFGVSIFGVVVTAAAFMLGLGIGALLGGRFSQRRQPLRLFAAIELSVAVYALLLPVILRGVDNGVTLLAPEALWLWYALQLAAALVLITLPAVVMGIGFPLILRAAQHSTLSLARLYGLNTCGAALGALLPLVLLPTLGWAGGVWLVALIGVTVAAGAWMLSHQSQPQAEPAQRSSLGGKAIPRLTLFAYAGVGAAALMLEVGWTRLFGMLLLRTEYVMAVILAVFLSGIGLGSLVARRLAARWWFDVLPVAAGIFALLSLWGIPGLAAWAESSDFDSLAAAMWGQGLAIALLTMPVTLLLGAWLPLLSARLGQDKAIGAVLYGANSIGAALGALLAGFVLVPWLGTAGAVVAAALLLFVAGTAWAARRSWLALPLLVALAWPVWQLPPVNQLLPSGQAGSRDLFVHEDALATTHVVEREDGQRLLLNDLQRMDASSEPLAVVSQQNQVRLPLLLHPEPRRVLFLGLGTGISAAASLPYPGLERTAVELSQGAIEAARTWFVPVNDHISDKMRVVRDDARRFLDTAGQSYDVIIGDLFHPDLVGRSALLSLQQFERAKSRLNSGGLFVQWLALNQFDPDSLQVVLRTFQRVFPEAVMFVDGFRLALVGGNGWQPSVQAVLGNLGRLDATARNAASGGEGSWSWIGRYWGRIQPTEGPLQSEWAPVIEYHLPRARYRGEMDLVALVEWLLARRPDLSRAGEVLQVVDEQRDTFERAYAATELSLRAWVAELNGDARQGQRLLRLAYQANPRDRWVSGALADRMYAGLQTMTSQADKRRKALEAILFVRPDHVDALSELWRLEQVEGNQARAAEYRAQLKRYSPLDAALR